MKDTEKLVAAMATGKSRAAEHVPVKSKGGRPKLAWDAPVFYLLTRRK